MKTVHTFCDTRPLTQNGKNIGVASTLLFGAWILLWRDNMNVARSHGRRITCVGGGNPRASKHKRNVFVKYIERWQHNTYNSSLVHEIKKSVRITPLSWCHVSSRFERKGRKYAQKKWCLWCANVAFCRGAMFDGANDESPMSQSLLASAGSQSNLSLGMRAWLFACLRIR